MSRLPHAIAICWQLIYSRRFVAFVLIYSAIGMLLHQLPAPARNAICDYYKVRLAAGMTAVVQRAIEAVASAPSSQAAAESSEASGSEYVSRIADAIELYVCQSDDSSPTAKEFHAPTLREARITLPGALVLAFLTVLMLPSAAAAKAIERQATEALRRDAARPAGLTGSGVGVIRSGSETDDLMRARALRVAVVYAILSCIATTLVRPDFQSTPDVRPWPSQNTWHILALAAAAVGAGIYGSWGFRGTTLHAFEISLGISARGIFLGGLIAVSIALPYQTLRPVESRTLGDGLVVFILVCRLLLLPLLSGILTLGLVTLLRRFTVNRG